MCEREQFVVDDSLCVQGALVRDGLWAVADRAGVAGWSVAAGSCCRESMDVGDVHEYRLMGVAGWKE